MFMNTIEIIWHNLKALMVHKYGCENLYKLNQESKIKGKDKEISLGSLTRIKAQDTDIRISVLDKIAEHFELFTWQLMIENLDVTNPPVFLSHKQQEFFDKMKKAYKEIAGQ
jgi:hypothetical protein